MSRDIPTIKLALLTLAVALIGCRSVNSVNDAGILENETETESAAADSDGDGDADTESDAPERDSELYVDSDSSSDTREPGESESDSRGDRETENEAPSDTGEESDSPSDIGQETDTATDTGVETDTDAKPVVADFSPTVLFPLAVGNSWTYQITPLSDSTSCDTDSETLTASILEESEVDGRQAFLLDMICYPDHTYLGYDGNAVVHYAGGEWNVSLAEPIEDGASWDYHDAVTFQWQYERQITVPAGTFDNCWTRIEDTTADETFSTYCPGVGKVREVRGNEYDFDAELVSYSLVKPQ